MTTDLEARISNALHAAAETIRPVARGPSAPFPHRPSALRRWALPLAAAAAVVAVLAVIVVPKTFDRQTAEPVQINLTVGAGGQRIATIDGVRFPIPPTWSVRLMEQSDVISACVEPTPGTGNSCDGITVRMARPGAPPLKEDPNFGCPPGQRSDSPLNDEHSAFDGRIWREYQFECINQSKQWRQWVSMDLALEVSGSADIKGHLHALVAGLDTSSWARPVGSPLIEVSATYATLPSYPSGIATTSVLSTSAEAAATPPFSAIASAIASDPHALASPAGTTG